ncbi:MAG TPA: histidine phosphatase family protein [Alphaproteobacteria bacterium]|nr:histidine phosphatase family protein [Alphaproteobacteria bacterium]
MRQAVLHALAAIGLLLLPSAARANEAVWNELRAGGLIVMLRHANAPGTGDPPGFRVGDCATQRNLSVEGRAQAAALGAAFRERGIPVGRVLSSRWCRALDTARLAFGTAEIEPALDSLYGRRDQAEAQNASTRAIMRARALTDTNLVMVTHNANIAALTGLSPADAEAIVVRLAPNDRLEIVGRLRP